MGRQHRFFVASRSVVAVVAHIRRRARRHGGRALTSTTQPTLTLNRLIRTSPFTGSSTSVRDNEDLAYVPSDDSLWMADDNGNAVYEINRTTGALKRTISQSTFSNSHQFGGSALATSKRNEDIEAVAYDRNADVLYIFSGSTSSTPTVYRLLRDASHNFQIDSWQPLADRVDRRRVAARRRQGLRRRLEQHPPLRLRLEHLRHGVLGERAQDDLRRRVRPGHRRHARGLEVREARPSQHGHARVHGRVGAASTSPGSA